MIRCDLGRDAFKNQLIAQSGYAPLEQRKAETLFCQGNGYLFLRGNFWDKSGGSLFASGFYDENNKPFNFADACGAELKVNGKKLSASSENVSDFLRVFNMRDGELRQSFTYKDEKCALKCAYSRFVSLKNEHLAASQLKLRVISGNADLSVSSGIAARGESPVKASAFDDGILQINYIFKDKRRQASISCGHRFYINSDQVLPSLHIKKSQCEISAEARFSLSENDSFILEKFSAMHTDRDLQYRDIKNFSASFDSLNSAREALGERYISHMLESRRLWKRYFEDNGALINSAQGLDELALNFAIYYLKIISHPFYKDPITGGFCLSAADNKECSKDILEALSPYYLLSSGIDLSSRDNLYLQYVNLLNKRKFKPESLCERCVAEYRAFNTDKAEKLLSRIVNSVFDAGQKTDTLHICGVWSCFVEGIAGIGLSDGILGIAPAKQSRVSLLQIPVWLGKRQILIRLEKDGFFVIVPGNESLALSVYGKSAALSPGIHGFSYKEPL